MKLKLYERNKLSKEIGCSPLTLRTYLCRSEFWHVTFHRLNRKMYYNGLTTDDIEKWNKKSEFSGKYEDLLNKPDLSAIKGMATEKYVNEGIRARRIYRWSIY